MPLYDTSIVHLMKYPLYEKGKRLKIIQYEDLCTVFGIETQKFPKIRDTTIRPLENEQVRKYAFDVEHLMTIMQEQLADKSSEEKQKIMSEIKEKIIKIIDRSREKKSLKMNTANQGHSLFYDYIVTVVVETETCKKIIQVFISF